MAACCQLLQRLEAAFQLGQSHRTTRNHTPTNPGLHGHTRKPERNL